MSRSNAHCPRPSVVVAAIAMVVLSIGACTSQAGASADPSGSTRPGSSLAPRPTVPPSDAPVTGEVPEGVMTAVLADLATRTGGDVSGAEVVTAEAMEWPDGSLGCPEPDMMYTQAIVPGYKVVLTLGGTTYDYRVGGEGDVIRLCENPGPLSQP